MMGFPVIDTMDLAALCWLADREAERTLRSLYHPVIAGRKYPSSPLDN